MSLFFDGTGSYAFSPQPLDLSNSLYLSISYWSRPSYHATNRILVESSANSQSNAGAIAIIPNSAVGEGVYTFRITKAVGTPDSFAISPRPSSGVWHHFVCTVDRTQTGIQVSVYIDNILSTGAHTVSAGSGAGGFGNHIWNFGARNASITPSIFAQGTLAELAIFTGVLLNENEVTALYYGTDPLELRSDIKPYNWKFEGDSQLYVQDSSARTNNLTVVTGIVNEHPPLPIDLTPWYDNYLDVISQGEALDGAFNSVARSISEFNIGAERSTSSYKAIDSSLSSNSSRSSELSFSAHLRASILSDLIKNSTISSSIAARLVTEPNIARETALNLTLLSRLGLSGNGSKTSSVNSLFTSDLSFFGGLNRSGGLNVEYANESFASFNSSRNSSLSGNINNELFASFNSSRNSSVSGSINNELSFYTDLLNSRLLNSTLPLNSDLSPSIGASKGASFESAIRLVMLSDGSTDSSVSIETLLTADSAISLSMERSSNIELSMANKLAFSSSLNRLISSSVIHTSSSDISAIIGSVRQLEAGMNGRLILIANTDNPSSLVLTYNFDVYIYTNYANVMNISRSLPVNLFILPNEC